MTERVSLHDQLQHLPSATGDYCRHGRAANPGKDRFAMNRIILGVVGLGYGNVIIESEILTGPGSRCFRLGAICDTNRERLEEAAQRYRVPAYESLDDLLSQPDIEAVGLFTAPGGRAELVRRIVRSGKDVVTTKPFELSSRAAVAVLREAAALGRVIWLNSPNAEMPTELRQIIKWIKCYSLGRPIGATIHFWYKNMEQADGSWYDDHERCPAAPLLRLGIYGMNDLVRLFGEAESAQVLETRLLTGRPTPDMAAANIRFRNGALAQLMCGWCLQPGSRESVYYFERGTVYVKPVLRPDDYGRTKFLASLLLAGHADGLQVCECQHLPDEDSFSYRWPACYRAIKERQPASLQFETNIVQGICLLEAIVQSSRSGRTEFVGEADDSRHSIS